MGFPSQDTLVSRKDEMPVIFCRTHCQTIRNRISMSDPLDIGRLHKTFFRDNDHTNSSICLNTSSLSRLPSPQGGYIMSPDGRGVRPRGERMGWAPLMAEWLKRERLLLTESQIANRSGL